MGSIPIASTDMKFVNSLSRFERRVLMAYLLNSSVADVGAALCVSRKSVQNALARIEAKAKKS